ncbi:MAG: alpha/beta hydrolase [Clostridium sp.]|nr:alpha/beta hydrolase [Clostridium sp.]
MEERFQAGGKEISLYISDKRDCPLIVLNTFEGGGAQVLEEARKLGGGDFSLLSVGGLDWNRDMSPWECAPVMAQDEGYAGGADSYLSLLLEEILPEGLKRLPESPSWIGIAGYSLAGLFALYALYRTDTFARAASMSGSLWFPGFGDFVRSHDMKRAPEKLYLSLGDKEAKTRNPYLKTVQENTEAAVQLYRDRGLDVTWELTPGNHFRDAEKRSAKGILGIL